MCVPDAFSLHSGSGRGFNCKRKSPARKKVRQWIKAHPSAVICGEVQRCQDTEYSLSVYLKQVYLTDQSEKIPIRNIRAFLKENIKEDLKTGMVIQVKGELERISAPGNPGEFDQQQYYACQKIYYFMKNAVVQKKSRSYSRYGQALTELREKIAETLPKSGMGTRQESIRPCFWEKRVVWMKM